MYRYLSAATTAQKGNITWGGQTFGGLFGSDGRLMGTSNISILPCDSSTQICRITLPAPSAALVFLYSPTSSDDAALTLAEKTFGTTRSTRTKNTATIDFAVMETSNGENGRSRLLGSTSEGMKKMHSAGTEERLREVWQVVMILVWVLRFVVLSI